MSLIDTHAHLTSETLLPDAENILERARAAGLTAIVNICTDKKSLEEGLKLSENYPWVYNTAATTPHDVEKEGEEFFPIVKLAAENRQLVAIGETGLDYYYAHSNKAVQQDFLRRYFALASSTQLPLVFHCREAFEDLFALADEAYKDKPAVLHCFTGTIQEAKQVLDQGWYVSMSGIVTFKKSEDLRDVAKFVPLDRLFLETDAPYLAPQSRRGKQNEPAFLLETAEVVARVKGISVEECANACAENAMRFFSFSKVR